METFAVTLKFNSLKAVPSDYVELLQKWLIDYNVDVHDFYYEDDGHGICHLHGLITIPRGFYRKRLQTPGLHFMISKLFDKDGWLEYCSKQSKIRYNNTSPN